MSVLDATSCSEGRMSVRRRGPRITVVALSALVGAILLIPVSSSGDSESAEPTSDIPSVEVADVPLDVENYTVSTLDFLTIARQANDLRSIQLDFGKSPYTIDLWPSAPVDFEVRAPRDIYRFVECRHFLGSVRGVPESAASVSFDDDGITARVSMPGTEYYMCPASTYDKSSLPGTEIIFSSEDVAIVPVFQRSDLHLSMPSASETSSTDMAPLEMSDSVLLGQAGAQPGPSPDNSTAVPSVLTMTQQTLGWRALRLYAGTDNLFRQSYDNAYIEDRVNMVNLWLQYVGVQIVIVGYLSWNHDSSNDLAIENCLEAFRTVARGTSQRNYDECNLFCGRDWQSGSSYVVGAAYERGAETGLFESNRPQYGFSVTSMNSRWTIHQKEETLAHEIGHTLNAVHDQAEPYFGAGYGTLMNYGDIVWHWYSNGNMSTSHNNAQRMAAWSAANLHAVIWHQLGDEYGSNPNDYLYLENLKVRVLDVPSSTDTILNVQFDLTWLPPQGVGGSSTSVDKVYTSLRSPTYVNKDFAIKRNINIARGGTYHYDSNGASNALGEYGQWRALAAYYYSGHYGAYYDSPVFVKRYYVLASTGGVQAACHGDYIVDVAGELNAPGLMVWNFRVLSLTTSTPHVGDTVDVYWTAFNTNPQVYLADGSSFYLYVACQSPGGSWYDFAYLTQTNWVQRSTSSMPGGWDDLNQNGAGNPAGGGVVLFLTSGMLNQAGTWRLIPDALAAGYYPWYGSEVHLTVAA